MRPGRYARPWGSTIRSDGGFLLLAVVVFVYVAVVLFIAASVAVAVRNGAAVPVDQTLFALVLAVLVAFWPGTLVYSVLKGWARR